jgi:hypothetical protein
VSISFVTPWAALVVLFVLLPLAVLIAEEERLHALCRRLGLRPPGWRPSLEMGAAFVALAAIIALAAAQPVLARHTTVKGRSDAEAFFVFDVSRSMAARTQNGPTRLDRARADAKKLRVQLGDVPVGVASITDRVLPHLFPSVSVNAFNGVLDESLAIDRPTTALAYGDTLGTKLGALADMVTANYFSAHAKKRVVVVFTDGETRPDNLSDLPSRFNDGGMKALFFRYWDPEERVYDSRGVLNPAYSPDATSGPLLNGLAQSLGTKVYGPGDVGAAAGTIGQLVGQGPTTTRGRELSSTLLTPYVLLLGLIPLAFVLWRRNLPADLRIRRRMTPTVDGGRAT